MQKGDKGFCDKNREEAGMVREEAEREREWEEEGARIGGSAVQ